MRFGAKRLAQDRSDFPMRTILIAAALLAAVAATIAARGGPEPLLGGNATIYLGARPNRILVIDEATEKVTGFIPTKSGYPENLNLSKDKSRFYVNTSTLQDVDI